MLKEAGAEHGKALVVNTASIAAKYPAAWLSAYSATKAAVVALSVAAQAELMDDGITVTAFCPAFVDTPMTEWVRGQVPPEDMIRPEDLGEAVRFLLHTSSACLIPASDCVRDGVAMSIGSSARDSSVLAAMTATSTAQRVRARASPTARTYTNPARQPATANSS